MILVLTLLLKGLPAKFAEAVKRQEKPMLQVTSLQTFQPCRKRKRGVLLNTGHQCKRPRLTEERMDLDPSSSGLHEFQKWKELNAPPLLIPLDHDFDHVSNCCSQQCRHMGQPRDAPEFRNVRLLSTQILSPISNHCNPYSLDTLATLGFETMTPVQAGAIPLFMKNKDVVVEVCHTKLLLVWRRNLKLDCRLSPAPAKH